MTDTAQRVRQLQKELAQAKSDLAASDRVGTRSNRLDVAGTDPNLQKRNIPGSSEIPDVILLPKKQRRTENKW